MTYPSPTYWAVVHGNKELLGVMESPEDPDLLYDEEESHINHKVGHGNWSWRQLTQAEFETYQAFDIREFKL